MSLFDRLISRGTGEQKGKPFLSNPHTKLVSELDAAIKKAKEQYQGDAATIDAFAHALKEHYKARCKETAEDQPPMKAEARFFLSHERVWLSPSAKKRRGRHDAGGVPGGSAL